jgi:hypothetical protein
MTASDLGGTATAKAGQPSDGRLPASALCSGVSSVYGAIEATAKERRA